MKSIAIERAENRLEGNEEYGSMPPISKRSQPKASKLQTLSLFRIVCSTYATIAAMYSHIGIQKKAEEVYEIYAAIIEK